MALTSKPNRRWTDTFDSPAGDPHLTRHGLHYRLGGAQGCFAIAEAVLTPVGGPARYLVGAWYHTAEFADMGNRGPAHSGNYGAYASVERTLRGKSGAAGYVTGHLRAGFAPADRNAIAWAVDAAVSATGLIPGRAADVTTLGFVHAALGQPFSAAAAAADPTSPAPDFEEAAELSHNLVFSERFSLQPDLQYIRHPGGSPSLPDATVLLLRAKLAF